MPKGTALLTRSGDLPRALAPDSKDLRDALAAGATVFETAHEPIYSRTSTTSCRSTPGATWAAACRAARRSATLRGQHPRLKPNDVLVFQEVVSPTTFTKADADRARRWAVRLTDVKAGVDPSGQLFDRNAGERTAGRDRDHSGMPPMRCRSRCAYRSRNSRVWRSAWRSATSCSPITAGRCARNVPDKVPEAQLHRVAATAGAHPCKRAKGEPIPVRFRPALANAPVTQGFDLAKGLAVPLALGKNPSAPPTQDEGWWPASALLARDPHDALAADRQSSKASSSLRRAPCPVLGRLRRDLLEATVSTATSSSKPRTMASLCCVSATTRMAERPDEEHGVHGDLPRRQRHRRQRRRGSISHIVSNVSGVFDEVTNPMPAAGGIDPEDIEAARRDAPEAFRTQERAVTAADYAAAAERRADVQRAAATFRWTGSWHTVFVTADRFGGARRRHALRGAAAPAPRTLPHGRLRPRGRLRRATWRSTSRCTSA